MWSLDAGHGWMWDRTDRRGRKLRRCTGCSRPWTGSSYELIPAGLRQRLRPSRAFLIVATEILGRWVKWECEALTVMPELHAVSLPPMQVAEAFIATSPAVSGYMIDHCVSVIDLEISRRLTAMAVVPEGTPTFGVGWDGVLTRHRSVDRG